MTQRIRRKFEPPLRMAEVRLGGSYSTPIRRSMQAIEKINTGVAQGIRHRRFESTCIFDIAFAVTMDGEVVDVNLSKRNGLRRRDDRPTL